LVYGIDCFLKGQKSVIRVHFISRFIKNWDKVVLAKKGSSLPLEIISSSVTTTSLRLITCNLCSWKCVVK